MLLMLRILHLPIGYANFAALYKGEWTVGLNLLALIFVVLYYVLSQAV